MSNSTTFILLRLPLTSRYVNLHTENNLICNNFSRRHKELNGVMLARKRKQHRIPPTIQSSRNPISKHNYSLLTFKFTLKI